MTSRLLLLSLILALSVISLPARKTGYKLKADKTETSKSEEMVLTRGSFMVASQCDDCNNGYHLSQIEFSGFDKPQSSTAETFMITNHTDRTMTGVNLYIDYLDMQGRQLTKKFLKLSCSIPPGETRMAEVKSFDNQKTYYYHLSTPSRKKGAPFTVVFDPVAFYLQF